MKSNSSRRKSQRVNKHTTTPTSTSTSKVKPKRQRKQLKCTVTIATSLHNPTAPFIPALKPLISPTLYLAIPNNEPDSARLELCITNQSTVSADDNNQQQLFVPAQFSSKLPTNHTKPINYDVLDHSGPSKPHRPSRSNTTRPFPQLTRLSQNRFSFRLPSISSLVATDSDSQQLDHVQSSSSENQIDPNDLKFNQENQIFLLDDIAAQTRTKITQIFAKISQRLVLFSSKLRQTHFTSLDHLNGLISAPKRAKLINKLHQFHQAVTTHTQLTSRHSLPNTNLVGMARTKLVLLTHVLSPQRARFMSTSVPIRQKRKIQKFPKNRKNHTIHKIRKIHKIHKISKRNASSVKKIANSTSNIDVEDQANTKKAPQPNQKLKLHKTLAAKLSHGDANHRPRGRTMAGLDGQDSGDYIQPLSDLTTTKKKTIQYSGNAPTTPKHSKTTPKHSQPRHSADNKATEAHKTHLKNDNNSTLKKAPRPTLLSNKFNPILVEKAQRLAILPTPQSLKQLPQLDFMYFDEKHINIPPKELKYFEFDDKYTQNNPHLTKLGSFFHPSHPSHYYYQNIQVESPQQRLHVEMLQDYRMGKYQQVSNNFRAQRHDYIMCQESQWSLLFNILISSNSELDFFEHLTYLITYRPVNWCADVRLIGLIIAGCYRFNAKGVLVGLITRHLDGFAQDGRFDPVTLSRFQPELITTRSLLLVHQYLMSSEWGSTDHNFSTFGDKSSNLANTPNGPDLQDFNQHQVHSGLVSRETSQVTARGLVQEGHKFKNLPPSQTVALRKGGVKNEIDFDNPDNNTNNPDKSMDNDDFDEIPTLGFGGKSTRTRQSRHTLKWYEPLTMVNNIQHYYNIGVAQKDPYYSELFSQLNTIGQIQEEHGKDLSQYFDKLENKNHEQSDDDNHPSHHANTKNKKNGQHNKNQLDLNKIYPGLYQSPSLHYTTIFDTPTNLVIPAQFDSFLQSLGLFWGQNYNTAVATTYHANNPLIMESYSHSTRFATSVSTVPFSVGEIHLREAGSEEEEDDNLNPTTPPEFKSENGKKLIFDVEAYLHASFNASNPLYQPKIPLPIQLTQRPGDHSIPNNEVLRSLSNGVLAFNTVGETLNSNTLPVELYSEDNHFKQAKLLAELNTVAFDTRFDAFVEFKSGDEDVSEQIIRQAVLEYDEKITKRERTKNTENTQNPDESSTIPTSLPHLLLKSHLAQKDSQLRLIRSGPGFVFGQGSNYLAPKWVSLTKNSPNLHHTSLNFARLYGNSPLQSTYTTVDHTNDGAVVLVEEMGRDDLGYESIHHRGDSMQYDDRHQVNISASDSNPLTQFSPTKTYKAPKRIVQQNQNDPRLHRAMSNIESLYLNGTKYDSLTQAKPLIDPIFLQKAAQNVSKTTEIPKKYLQNLDFDPSSANLIPKQCILRSFANNLIDERGTVASGTFAGYNPNLLASLSLTKDRLDTKVNQNRVRKALYDALQSQEPLGNIDSVLNHNDDPNNDNNSTKNENLQSKSTIPDITTENPLETIMADPLQPATNWSQINQYHEQYGQHVGRTDLNTSIAPAQSLAGPWEGEFDFLKTAQNVGDDEQTDPKAAAKSEKKFQLAENKHKRVVIQDLVRVHLLRLLTCGYNIDPQGLCFDPTLTTEISPPLITPSSTLPQLETSTSNKTHHAPESTPPTSNPNTESITLPPFSLPFSMGMSIFHQQRPRSSNCVKNFDQNLSVLSLDTTYGTVDVTMLAEWKEKLHVELDLKTSLDFSEDNTNQRSDAFTKFQDKMQKLGERWTTVPKLEQNMTLNDVMCYLLDIGDQDYHRKQHISDIQSLRTGRLQNKPKLSPSSSSSSSSQHQSIHDLLQRNLYTRGLDIIKSDNDDVWDDYQTELKHNFDVSEERRIINYNKIHFQQSTLQNHAKSLPFSRPDQSSATQFSQLDDGYGDGYGGGGYYDTSTQPYLDLVDDHQDPSIKQLQQAQLTRQQYNRPQQPKRYTLSPYLIGVLYAIGYTPEAIASVFESISHLNHHYMTQYGSSLSKTFPILPLIPHNRRFKRVLNKNKNIIKNDNSTWERLSQSEHQFHVWNQTQQQEQQQPSANLTDSHSNSSFPQPRKKISQKFHLPIENPLEIDPILYPQIILDLEDDDEAGGIDEVPSKDFEKIFMNLSDPQTLSHLSKMNFSHQIVRDLAELLRYSTPGSSSLASNEGITKFKQHRDNILFQKDPLYQLQHQIYTPPSQSPYSTIINQHEAEFEQDAAEYSKSNHRFSKSANHQDSQFTVQFGDSGDQFTLDQSPSPHTITRLTHTASPFLLLAPSVVVLDKIESDLFKQQQQQQQQQQKQNRTKKKMKALSIFIVTLVSLEKQILIYSHALRSLPIVT